MSDPQYIPHAFSHANVKGSILTARLAKTSFRGIEADFKLFMVPHRQSIIESPTALSGMAWFNHAMKFNQDDGSPNPPRINISELDLHRPDPLHYSTVDMRDVPLGSIAFNMGMKHPLFDVWPMARPQKTPYFTGVNADVGGHFHDNIQVGARNGTLFKVYGKLRTSAELGEPTMAGGFFIRVFSGASYKKVSMELPELRGYGRRAETAYIEGRFEIIALHEAYRRGIVPLPTGLEHQYDGIDTSLFAVEEIMPPLEDTTKGLARVDVLNKQGEKVSVNVMKRRRKVGPQG